MKSIISDVSVVTEISEITVEEGFDRENQMQSRSFAYHPQAEEGAWGSVRSG
jgi:hypothetical protein